MAYDSPVFAAIIQPMRDELTAIGFSEVHTPEAVDEVLASHQGTMMLVVNSICGCAAGIARPAIAEAIAMGPAPDHLYTVFAGQDVEATAQARTYFTNFPPSSPSIAFFKDGKFVNLIERHQIEKHTKEDVTGLIVEELQRLDA